MPDSKVLSRSYRMLVILVLALSAYWPTLRLGFLWDDHVMIESNPALRSWSAAHLKHDFTTDVFDGHGNPYYRPLQTLANRLDYTLWGLHPFGYHLTNFAYHAGNSLLIGELVLALGLGPLIALLAGGLFAVHPIGVEQLMIIAGRAELMSFFFLLANLLLFLQAGPLMLAAGTAAYACALLSKESAVIAPALLLLLWWQRRDQRSVISRLWIYALVTLPYFLLRSAAVGSRLPPVSPDLLFRFYGMAFPKIMTIYARLILAPWNLHSHRLIPHLSHAWFLYGAGWVALAFWLFKRRERWAFTCYGLFVLTLLPKTPAMMAGNFTLDHWAYPAAAGVIIPLAVGFVRCWEDHRQTWRYGVAAAFFPLLIIWALLVHLNVELRGTDEKMYRWALHFTTSRPIKYNLGLLLLQTGRPREALQYLQEVHTAYPEDHDNTHAIAIAYWQTGHQESAIRLLEELVKENPVYPPAVQSLNRMQAELRRKP